MPDHFPSSRRSRVRRKRCRERPGLPCERFARGYKKRDERRTGIGQKPVIPPGQKRARDYDNQPPNAERPRPPLQCRLPGRRRCWSLCSYSGAQISVYAGTVLPARRPTGMKRCLLFAIAIAAPLAAQSPCPDNQNSGDRDRASRCEIREFTLTDTGRLNVDSATNGGIRVTGADRSNVLVRARVQTNAHYRRTKPRRCAQVRVEAVPGTVRADGPENFEDRGWARKLRNPGPAALRAGP